MKKSKFTVERTPGNALRFSVRGTYGHVGWWVNSEKGPLRSFVTHGGAQALCDQLNAAGDIAPPADLLPPQHRSTR